MIGAERVGLVIQYLLYQEGSLFFFFAFSGGKANIR